MRVLLLGLPPMLRDVIRASLDKAPGMQLLAIRPVHDAIARELERSGRVVLISSLAEDRVLLELGEFITSNSPLINIARDGTGITTFRSDGTVTALKDSSPDTLADLLQRLMK